MFLGIQQINIFWGMKILWIFFGGHHKIGLYLGVILCILGSFLKVKVQNGGCLKFLIFFGVNGRCRVRTYV